MSTQSKKSLGWTTVLIVFGLVALFGGMKVLLVLIAATCLIWYGIARPLFAGPN